MANIKKILMFTKIGGKEYIKVPSRLANNLDFDGKPISCEIK